MAVMMARERWTDERLDKAFDRVDADLREIRVEMKRGFERLDARLESMQSETNARFEALQSETTKRFESAQSEMNLRFDAVQRNMMTWAVALFSAIVTLNGAVIAAIALT